jgi:4-amino-4-deoxy-L-arabinose transferase-like glycosyltransferase
LPLIDRDEPRFAEASREMRQRADYIVPYFNNQFRFDKPPLTYWFQVASYRVFGENDFAARFPSAVAATLTALLLFGWGCRTCTHHVGLWAAIIFTLSFQTFMHAKAAVADMWLVLFMTAAHWAGWMLMERSKRSTLNVQRPTPKAFASEASNSNEETSSGTFVWWLIFYASLALAFLAKGPIGCLPLVTVGIATLVISKGRQISPVKTAIITGAGIVLMFGIVAIWAVPALTRTNGEFFRIGIGRHVVARSVGVMEGHGGSGFGWYLLTLPFYFITVFVSFLPWSFKLPWLARHLRNRDPLDNYLVTGAAVIFLVFTLVSTKLPHYTLPALPLLSLLLARHVAIHFHGEKTLRRMAIGCAIVYLAIALFICPLVRRAFPTIALYEAARSELRPDMEFGAIGYTEPSLVWYFRSAVNGWMTVLNASRAREFMEKPGGRFVIMPRSVAENVFRTLPQDWKKFSASGINIAKGKRVELVLILKPL